MINHYNAKSTELVFPDWKLATGLKDYDFKLPALGNLR